MTTTMGTDSESQDSDDGRRFRFEATRKDATSALEAKRREMISLSREISRGSRSHDRPGNNSGQAIRGDHNDNRYRSKERKVSKKELRRKDDNIRYRHMKNHSSKESRESSGRNSRSRDVRESKTPIDEKRKRSRERNRDRYVQHSQGDERSSRDQLHQEDQHRDKKINRKYSRDHFEKVSKIHEIQDCKNMSLSDFDVISDTEEFTLRNFKNKSSVEMSSRKLNQQGNSDAINEVKNLDNGDHHHHHHDSKRSTAPSNFDNNDVSKFLSVSANLSCSYNNDNNIVMNEANNGNNNGKEIDKTLYIRKNFYDNFKEIGDSYRPILSQSSSKWCSERKIIGPSLPDQLKKPCETESSNLNEDAFGPALPPYLVNKNCEIFTEVLPEKMETSDTVEHANDGDSNSDDDNGCIGPLPVYHPALQEDLVQQQLEYRARMIKRELAKIDNNADDKKREEWMTELPSIHIANLGLGPRNFRSKPGPDISDRSGWTDTPADRIKKQREKMLMIGKSAKIENLTESASTMPCKRKEISLLETHQKKLRKKKKKEDKKAKEAGKLVRRPFDRDIDMEVNRFDEAKKKTLFMKAAALDDRFSRGNI